MVIIVLLMSPLAGPDQARVGMSVGSLQYVVGDIVLHSQLYIYKSAK